MRYLANWCEKDQPGIVLLPWLVPAISALALKYSILSCGAFRESALGVRASGTLTIWEQISLFRSDLLLCAVFIPLVLCFIAYWLPLRWRIVLPAVFSVVVVTWLNLQVTVYNATGAFASATNLWAAITWAISNHNKSIVSIPLTAEIEIVAWITGVGLASAIAMIAIRRPVRRLNYACLLVLGIGAVASAVLLVHRVPDMAWSPSLLAQTGNATLLGNNSDADMLARSVPELLRLYRQTSDFPAASPSTYIGKGQGYNVLLFVLEAIPAQVFDPARDSLRDMPNVRRLREHAFLSERHYTTFPFTSYAMFSLFTSLYAKENIGNRQTQLPGLIYSLRTAGYKTAFYGYVWNIPSQCDDCMLASLGFEKIVKPTIDPAVDRLGEATFVGPVDYVEGHDLQVLRSLREDIRHWTREHQKFAAAFFPEIAHDPWRELNGHKSSSMQDRGHALAVYQDAWLGQLLDELDHDGALDSTIIVVTSDHGLRMLTASPGQPARLVSRGKLDDIVIRVPLLIYVPKVLPHSVTVDWPTSHIDITPTILDILGVTEGRQFEEGTDIWNRGTVNRRLFLSMDTFGAAGLFQGGSYYTRDGANTVFKSATLHFEDADVLPFAGKEAVNVRRALLDQDRLQHALLLHLLDDNPLGRRTK